MMTILPADRLRIAALAMGAFPVPVIFCAVKKIEPAADPHRRMAASLRSPEEATDE